jgi:hypothetical protein
MHRNRPLFTGSFLELYCSSPGNLCIHEWYGGENHFKTEVCMRCAKNICTIVLFISFYSFAGIDLKIGGGLNISGERYTGGKKLQDYYNQNMHVGFNAGVNVALPFSRQMGIVTGLSYETRGSGWKIEEVKYGGPLSADFSMNYFQIPALFFYRPIPALAIGLGPELGIFLTGKSKEGDETKDLNEIKPIDFGASLTVDYIFANMIAVGAGYYFGFLNNDDRPDENLPKGSITNNNIKIFVAYIFHL